MPRCFIGLNLPPQIKAEFSQIQADLKIKNKDSKITWVDPKIAHINLRFLGDLDKNRVNTLSEELKALESKYGPILAFLTGVGAFPSLKNPRILFLGVKHKNENNLIKLYSDLGPILNHQNIPTEDRPFIAHITLGRIKEAKNSVEFIGEEMPDIEFKIGTFELMESILTPHGPEYKVIQSYDL